MNINQNIWQYILLGLFALLTTLFIGLHTASIKAVILVLAILLFCLWLFLFIYSPIMKRSASKKENMLVKQPGDIEALQELSAQGQEYCIDLIEYYNGTRHRMRLYFIASQVSIALLTGVTPVLILIEQSKLFGEAGPPSELKWAMFIVPAVASIIATVSTIFHFEETWIQSKTTAESLEAKLQEYMVGSSDLFRISEDNEKLKIRQRKRALDNLIMTFNGIHLKQMNTWASMQNSDKPVSADASLGDSQMKNLQAAADQFKSQESVGKYATYEGVDSTSFNEEDISAFEPNPFKGGESNHSRPTYTRSLNGQGLEDSKVTDPRGATPTIPDLDTSDSNKNDWERFIM